MNIQGHELIKEKEGVFIIKQEEGMNVPVKLFTSEALLKNLTTDDSIQQACNVATLPGIQIASMAMPDMHQGYGFSIGGVAAFDMNSGIISPGGIGFDINCGVRLLTTPLTREEVEEKKEELINQLFKRCSVGVGSESIIRLNDEDYNNILIRGAIWAVENGYGNKEDIEHCESNGVIEGADISKVSLRALKRGKKQLGTVGAGNHFVEVQYVNEIFDEVAAKTYGLKKNQVVLMIHCGSRGFGHQVCTDYIRRMEEEQPELANKLVDKNLIYAKLGTELANDYFSAMAAAANYAFTNRHILGHFVREAFARVFGNDIKEKIHTVYDVTHNIAKKEVYIINGEEKEVMVHRKGATRAFPPGHPEIPEAYKDIGQPVLIPGSMGTSSFVLKGTKEAMDISFGSTAHGAGRVMSRFQAKKDFDADRVSDDLNKKNIFLKAASKRGIVEESPGAYKDVDEVMRISDVTGLAKKVAKLKPMGVIKG